MSKQTDTSIFGHIRFKSRAEVSMHSLTVNLSVAKADCRITLGLSPAVLIMSRRVPRNRLKGQDGEAVSARYENRTSP